MAKVTGIGGVFFKRIDNMAEMLAELQRNGVEILKGPESDENGKFAWK